MAVQSGLTFCQIVWCRDGLIGTVQPVIFYDKSGMRNEPFFVNKTNLPLKLCNSNSRIHKNTIVFIKTMWIRRLDVA